MASTKQKALIIDGKRLLPIAEAARQAGVSISSMADYASSGIIEQIYHKRFRFIVESSMTQLKVNPPPAWNCSEWIAQDGKKYLPVSKGASLLGIDSTTLIKWVNDGRMPVDFDVDFLTFGVKKKRLFVAEDSLLALGHIMEGHRRSVRRAAKGTENRLSYGVPCLTRDTKSDEPTL